VFGGLFLKNPFIHLCHKFKPIKIPTMETGIIFGIIQASVWGLVFILMAGSEIYEHIKGEF
jgi:hypothetical protein